MLTCLFHTLTEVIYSKLTHFTKSHLWRFSIRLVILFSILVFNSNSVYSARLRNATILEQYGIGHTNSLSYSSDNNILVAGNGITLIDRSSGETIRQYIGHQDIINSAVYSSDATLIASGGYDKTVRLWNAESGELLKTYQAPSEVMKVMFSPDNSQILAMCWYQPAIIWDINSGEIVGTYEQNIVIEDIAYCRDGASIITATMSGTKRWDIETADCLATFNPGVNCTSVTVSPDESTLLISDTSTSLGLWSLESGEKISVLSENKIVENPLFSSDGTYVFAACEENDQILTKQWNVETGVEVSTYNGHINALSPDGTELACCDSLSIDFWDMESNSKSHSVNLGYLYIYPSAVSNDQSKLAFRLENKILIRDIESSQLISVLTDHDSIPTNAEFSSDPLIIGTAIRDYSIPANNKVFLWNIYTGEKLKTFIVNDYFTHFRFSPDGSQIITKGENVKLWDVDSGELLEIVPLPVGIIKDAVFSTSGDSVVVCGNDGYIRWFNIDSGLFERDFHSTYGIITSLFFSEDGSKFCLNGTKSAKSSFSVYETENLNLLYYNEDLPSNGWSPTMFSPNGNQLLVVTNYKQKLIDLQNGSDLLCFPFETEGSTNIVFGLDHSTLMIVYLSGAVILWDTKSHESGFCLY